MLQVQEEVVIEEGSNSVSMYRFAILSYRLMLLLVSGEAVPAGTYSYVQKLHLY